MFSYGTTLVSGVQNIAALLSLIGTEQCQDQAGSALSFGYLFAAAAPLSMFGSIGLCQAGIRAVISNLVIPSWGILGAEILRDAGFKPVGKNLGLIMMDPAHPGRHLAETRLDELLDHFMIIDEKKGPMLWDWESKGILEWDLKLVLFTLLSCAMSVTPYIWLNSTAGQHLSFRLLYPTMRALGSLLIVISLQVLIQWRVMMIVSARNVFWKLNPSVKPEILDRSSWSPEISSEKCLWNLRKELDEPCGPVWYRLVRAVSATLRRLTNSNPSISADIEKSSDLDRLRIEYERASANTGPSNAHRYVLPFAFLTCLGIITSIAGFIGCFTLIQNDDQPSHDPLYWLAAEASLSLMRIIIWSWNPIWNDTPEIHVELGRPPTCFPQSPPTLITDPNNNARIPLQDARKFLDSVTKHSGQVLQPLDYPAITFLYALIYQPTAQQCAKECPLLYIGVYDHLRKTLNICYETSNSDEFFVCPASLTTDRSGFHAQIGGSANAGIQYDFITDNPELRFTLRKHYSVVSGRATSKTVESQSIRCDWTLRPIDLIEVKSNIRSTT